MTDPVRLEVVSFETIVQADVVAVLESVLADAKAGRITGVLIVADVLGGGWKPYSSGIVEYPRMVGLVELAKLQWATEYFESV